MFTVLEVGAFFLGLGVYAAASFIKQQWPPFWVMLLLLVPTALVRMVRIATSYIVDEGED